MSILLDVKRRADLEQLSLRELAKQCGISFATLSRLFRGVGEPSGLTRKRLEAWLDNVPLKPVIAKRHYSTVVTLGGISFRLSLDEIAKTEG